jgi:signal transduction histidine kinase
MSVADDVDGVVRAYLDHVAALRRYPCMVLLHESDGRSPLLAAGRWRPEAGLQRWRERVPWLAATYNPALDDGLTVTLADWRTDARVSAAFRREHTRRGTSPALAFIPLMVGGRRIGLVALSATEPHPWTEAELRPYQVTAAHLAAAIESRRLQTLSAERGQRLAVLEERQRLARELHDAVAQSVFSATLLAQTVAETWAADPEAGARRLERLLSLNRSALAELRALVAELRPVEGEAAAPVEADATGTALVRREGRVAALRRQAEAFAADGLHVDLTVNDYRSEPPEVEQELFRIIQEALHNAVKHARARRVNLVLMSGGGYVRLTVQDDGTGFSVPEPGEALPRGDGSGQGLAIMRERAGALGGSLALVSAPGAGTVVDVTLPAGGLLP